jgi:predicted nucleotidyltransferase
VLLPTRSSRTAAKTLDEIDGWLTRHDAADGVALFGSSARQRVGPASDYDTVL